MNAHLKEENPKLPHKKHVIFYEEASKRPTHMGYGGPSGCGIFLPFFASSMACARSHVSSMCLTHKIHTYLNYILLNFAIDIGNLMRKNPKKIQNPFLQVNYPIN
jgi:hypothetical protein